MKVILGTKLGMTQLIGEDGVITPVTLLQAGPCKVAQVKTIDADGYRAAQIVQSAAKTAGKLTSKPVQGHLAKNSIEGGVSAIREFRIGEKDEVKSGDELTVANFSLGDKVRVSGISKGKGFAGTVKRHNFNESRNTHGFKGNIRRVGSIGSMYPQKVMKGKKMPGRMGAERVTVAGLTVALVDIENNLLGIKGAIPGPKKGLIEVRGE
ncbi:MAG: 50S ribosomal protein L3 [Candidatus Nomurabacteria bacterium]|jgi:large subunit ribosomal protein L3|nr:50S ribosomal protein L3 [Candidatus Nomurabacteria bacterium]